MTNLQKYSKIIDRILNQEDGYVQQRLFDQYTSIIDENAKESFVLAIIGKVIMLQMRIKLMESRNLSA